MLLAMLAHYLTRDLTPHIDRSKCLHQSIKASCLRCAQFCPSEAVVDGDKLEFIDNKCLGCGLCVAACPAQCLKSPYLNWSATLKAIYSAGSAQFGCSKSKSSTINTLVPCLGSIPADLFAAVDRLTKREFTIDLGPCINCKNRKAIKQLRRSLRRASLISGRPVRFHTINNSSKDQNKQPAMNNPANFNIHELSKLINHCLDYTDRLFNSQDKEYSSPRAILIQAAELNHRVVFNLPSWQVNSTCTGCSRCVGACPNSAWDLTYEGNTAGLMHFPLRCLNCGHCRDICPQDSLQYAPLSWCKESSASFEKRVFAIKPCKNCLQVIIDKSSSEALCKPCLNKEKLRKGLLEMFV